MIVSSPHCRSASVSRTPSRAPCRRACLHGGVFPGRDVIDRATRAQRDDLVRAVAGADDEPIVRREMGGSTPWLQSCAVHVSRVAAGTGAGDLETVVFIDPNHPMR